MNETSPAAPSSTAADLPIVEEYRVLSPAAVLTFLAGLASALALAHPLMLVVPLATLALAAWSLRSMSVERTAGRGLVVAGVCLAVLFMGLSVGSRVTHQAILRQRARQFADDWLQIVVAEGDLYRGHQLHVSRESRLDPQVNFEQQYQTDDLAGNSFRSFIDQPGIKKLLSAGPDARIQFVRCVMLTRRRLAEEVVMEYRVAGRDEEFPVWVTVRRTFEDPYRGPDWELFDVSSDRPLY